MWNFPLNPISYKIYAIAHYNNGRGTWNEFFSDLKSIQSVHKLVQLNQTGKATLVNVLNAIVKLSNVFPDDMALGRLILINASESITSDIKTILYFLGKLPPKIPEKNLEDFPLNENLLDELEVCKI